MTFTEIVTEIAAHLNVTSSEGSTRIGRLVNICYKRVTTAMGMQMSRRVFAVGGATAEGSKLVTFEGIEKVTRVYNDNSGSVQVLGERTFDQLREKNPGASDPTEWAPYRQGAGSATILLNVVAQEVMTLRADGYETVDTLSGSNEPSFPESFHDVLVHGVLQPELKKKNDLQGSRDSKQEYEQRLSDLRMWYAKRLREQGRQGQNRRRLVTASSVGGGGASGSTPNGAASWEQTGTIAFNRDGTGVAPFTVASDNNGKVDNLNADLLDGLDSTAFASIPVNLATQVTGDLPFSNLAQIATDRLVGRDTAGTGDIEALTVGGGIEFTGSGGIQTSAFTGDVTKAAGGTAQTIANDAVTYAKMQNVSAASRLLGRGSAAGAGDPEEITLSRITMAATVLSASGVLDRDVVAATVANTTTETAVYSFSIPANTISTNRMIRLTLFGDYLNDAGGAFDLTVRVKFGGTTIATSTQNITNNAARRAVILESWVAAQNATNAQRALTVLRTGAALANGSMDANLSHHIGRHTGLTVDTTASATLEVTVQHGSASTNLSFIAQEAFLEILE